MAYLPTEFDKTAKVISEGHTTQTDRREECDLINLDLLFEESRIKVKLVHVDWVNNTLN
jgi:hypothetical protein